MKKFFNRYKIFLATFFVISVIILFLFYDALNIDKKLPIYHPAMVNYELVDNSIQHVKKYHKIAPFSLINQNGKIITEKVYLNKIYVADFFFTTCPSICPKMTENMGLIQEAFRDDNQIQLVSFSVTPKIDSVAQLKKYAIEKGVLDSKWNLLTGDKKLIYNLARKSFLAAKNDGDGGPHDMIHTENFVLVDKEKRIRGFYDGTDDKDIQVLKKDIDILIEEYN